MSEILEREIDKLKKSVSAISTRVEENMNQSIEAFIRHDFDTAKTIMENDAEIDQLEIEVEEECLKILALHQPVAVDLRYIISVLKINNDLERIGDLTTNIAGVVVYLSDKKKIPVPPSISEMTGIVSKMLKDCLDSLFKKDLELAASVRKADDKVDDLHLKMYQTVKDRVIESTDSIDQMMPLLSVSRYLERIADHCTNIAEDVEYFVKGVITRHHGR